MLFLSDAYKYFFGVDVCDSFIYNGRGQYDLFSPASSLVVVCLTYIYKKSVLSFSMNLYEFRAISDHLCFVFSCFRLMVVLKNFQTVRRKHDRSGFFLGEAAG